MKNYKNLVLIPSVLLFLALANTAYAGCSGSACKDVVITQKNGCIVIVNDGNRKVKIEFKNTFTHSPVVYPRSEKTVYAVQGLSLSNQCMRSVGSDYKARYVN